MNSICDQIRSHYQSTWGSIPVARNWHSGPIADLPQEFVILEFAPTSKRQMWTYATCGMCHPADSEPLELHLHSPVQSELHVELLTVIAHFHRTNTLLGLGHTVNFGRPWLEDSAAEYGLISLPYLGGPELEKCHLKDEKAAVNCLWLIPITQAERDYKKANGLEALERKFDQAKLDYLNPHRNSVGLS